MKKESLLNKIIYLNIIINSTDEALETLEEITDHLGDELNENDMVLINNATTTMEYLLNQLVDRSNALEHQLIGTEKPTNLQ